MLGIFQREQAGLTFSWCHTSPRFPGSAEDTEEKMINFYAGSCRAVTHIKAPLFHFTATFLQRKSPFLCRNSSVSALVHSPRSPPPLTLFIPLYSSLTTALMTSQISGETEAGASVRKHLLLPDLLLFCIFVSLTCFRSSNSDRETRVTHFLNDDVIHRGNKAIHL